MKGSDRQAAKPRAINTAIRGRAEKLERSDRETSAPRFDPRDSFRDSIDRRLASIRVERIVNPHAWNRMNAHSTVQGSHSARRKIHETRGRHVASTCPLLRERAMCIVSVHYPRPKYERERGTGSALAIYFWN